MEPAPIYADTEQKDLNGVQALNGQTQGNFQMNHQGVTSHKSMISSLNGIFVKQRMNMMEVVTGCEMENIFDIFQKHPNKEKITGKRIWRALEESTCVQRNCVQQNCRSFRVKIMNMLGGTLDNPPTVLRMERPCTCTSLCLNRPFITMNYTENNENVYLGKISDPYNAFKIIFEIFDNQNKPIYKIETYCVQCGVVCRGCPCGPCERVSFQVVDLRTGQILPPITKLNQICLKDFINDSDNFSMEFPPSSSWEEKSLLLGAILFLDYMMFEDKGGV